MYKILVGNYSNPIEANKDLIKSILIGFDGKIIKNKDCYSILIGPFAKYEIAVAVKKRLEKIFKKINIIK